MEVVKRQKYSKRSEDCAQNHEKIWIIVWGSPTPPMGKSWSAGTQIRKSVEQTVPGGQAKREMGHGHFLHPHKRRHFISVYDPRSVWQQYCGLQDCKSADCESCSGHDSSGNEERESRCGVAAPQRPRLSIHIASILQANTILRHNAVHVKERKSLWQCHGRKFLLHSENRVHLPPQAKDAPRSKRTDRQVYLLL